MPRSRQVRAHAGDESDNLWKAEGIKNTKPKAQRPDECKRSKLRCQLGGAEFVCLGVFVSQLGCVLIESSFLVSR